MAEADVQPARLLTDPYPPVVGPAVVELGGHLFEDLRGDEVGVLGDHSGDAAHIQALEYIKSTFGPLDNRDAKVLRALRAFAVNQTDRHILLVLLALPSDASLSHFAASLPG